MNISHARLRSERSVFFQLFARNQLLPRLMRTSAMTAIYMQVFSEFSCHPFVIIGPLYFKWKFLTNIICVTTILFFELFSIILCYYNNIIIFYYLNILVYVNRMSEPLLNDAILRLIWNLVNILAMTYVMAVFNFRENGVMCDTWIA